MKDLFSNLQRMPSQTDVLLSDTALVVVDVQFMFCSMPDNKEPTQNALKRIEWLRDLCDEYAIPSILVFYTVKGGMENDFVVPKGAEALYYQRLSGAFEIAQKDYTSAFENHYRVLERTRFQTCLQDYPNVKRLVFVGVNTSVCVAASARDAVKWGYESVVLADACANVSLVTYGGDAQQDHEVTLRSLAGHHKVLVSDYLKFKKHLGTRRPLERLIDPNVADVPIGLPSL